MPQTFSEIDPGKLREPIPENEHCDLRPVSSGWEIYWEHSMHCEPAGLNIYPRKRLVQGFIYLDFSGKEIGRKKVEGDWQEVKEGVDWATKPALHAPDADKIRRETAAIKFYQPGAKAQ